MKKVILIFLVMTSILILSIIIESCCHAKDYKFEWKTISLKYLDKTINENERIFGKESSSDVFQFDKFGVRILFHGDLITKNLIDFSLIQTANAQVDCFNNYAPKYKIDKIQIETLADFDELKLHNSDISNYFKATKYNGMLVSIEDLLNDNNKINGESTNESVLDQSIDLFLIESPKTDSIFRFVVKIHFNNDMTLIDTTKTIKILK